MKTLDRSRPFGQSFPPVGEKVYQQDDCWFDARGNLVAEDDAAPAKDATAQDGVPAPRKGRQPKKAAKAPEPEASIPVADDQIAAQLAEDEA